MSRFSNDLLDVAISFQTLFTKFPLFISENVIFRATKGSVEN